LRGDKTLKIFNTLTRRKEEFKPLGKVVRIYTCGPSVYERSHIGNFRTFVFEDVLVRYLKFKGYRVKRVMNITDIEDKAIEAARREGRTLKELTEHYTKIFFEDVRELNLLPADVFPKASEHIQDIVRLIKRIVKNGCAYVGGDGSIYFDISKFKRYGKLSRLKLRRGKRRIKRDEWGEETGIVADFAIWKSHDKKDGDAFWVTDLGKGRPGWHIECSAMSYKYLGDHFDMHIGGKDNIFPHHENVIAQTFAAFGKNPSKYWLHCKHLIVEGKKMSKSAGNYFTLSDLTRQGFKPMAIRYLLLSAGYRRRLNFNLAALREAEGKLEKIKDALKRIQGSSGDDDAEKFLERAKRKFERAMDDNLNTGRALKVLEEFVDEIDRLSLSKSSRNKAIKVLRDFDLILGLKLFE
jgi:cysteinyl-tRNA synthetase